MPISTASSESHSATAESAEQEGGLSRSFYTGFSVSQAVRFAAAVSERVRSADPECTVSVGIATSSTAVFGLLGLQQSPQEWGAIGEGRSLAEKLSSKQSKRSCISLHCKAA